MTASVTVSPDTSRRRLHLCERHGAHLLGGVILALDVDDGAATLALLDLIRHGLDLGGALGVLAAHEALDGEHGVLGVGDSLVLSGLTHDAVASARKPTTDGVVRSPSAFTIMVGEPPSRTAIAELVVPRSIPRILLIRNSLSLLRSRRLDGLSRGASACLSGCSVSPYGPEYTKSKSIHIRFLISESLGS